MRRLPPLASAALLAVALVAAPPGAHAGKVIDDGDFSAWSLGAYGTSTATTTRENSGGNPGPRIAVGTSTFTCATGYGIAYKNDYATTAPLAGVAFTFTVDVLSGAGAIGDGQGLQLVVEQNGTLYAKNLGITGVRNAFTAVAFNGTLDAASFARVQGGGPLQPDFSGGTSTRFGFAAGNTCTPANTHYYDNAKLDLAGFAGTCAGFSDVLDSDIFCLSAQWLKNRGITTGCTATQYCPTAAVTRAQMALFMNRLGNALTPDVLHKQAQVSNFVVATAPPGTLACSTGDYTAVGFGRTARFAGTLAAQASGGAASLQGYWRYSTDAGTTWQYVGDWLVDQFPAGTTPAAGQIAAVSVLAPPLDLDAGVAYRFGLFVDGVGVASTFNPLVCQIEVTIAGGLVP